MYPYGSFLGINDYFYEHEESSFCVAAGWSYQQSKQYDGMSELALANVEALAWYELPDFEVNCGSQESISSFLLSTIL